MAIRPRKWLDRKLRERAFRRWSEVAENAAGFGPLRKRALREEAISLRRQLDLVLMRTDLQTGLSRDGLIARLADCLTQPDGPGAN